MRSIRFDTRNKKPKLYNVAVVSAIALVVSIILGRAVRNALVQAGILSQSGK